MDFNEQPQEIAANELLSLQPQPQQVQQEQEDDAKPERRQRRPFSEEERQALLLGLAQHGCSWVNILRAPYAACFRDNHRTNINLKDLAVTMAKQQARWGVPRPKRGALSVVNLGAKEMVRDDGTMIDPVTGVTAVKKTRGAKRKATQIQNKLVQQLGESAERVASIGAASHLIHLRSPSPTPHHVATMSQSSTSFNDSLSGNEGSPMLSQLKMQPLINVDMMDLPTAATTHYVSSQSSMPTPCMAATLAGSRVVPISYQKRQAPPTPRQQSPITTNLAQQRATALRFGVPGDNIKRHSEM